MSKKKKKEKIVYYDDNSTIADMSAVEGGLPRVKGDKRNNVSSVRSTAKEKWTTYWTAVKMMFKPMLIVLLVITILFLLLMLFFGNS